MAGKNPGAAIKQAKATATKQRPAEMHGLAGQGAWAMSAFARAMTFILLWEGGYVDHPDDPGGETNFGISRKAHPDEDIAGMTKERALEIYRAEYWDRLNLGDLPSAASLVIMDAAVNMGRGRAVKMAQQAVNDMHGRDTLAVDGALGRLSREALMRWCLGTADLMSCHGRTLALAYRMIHLRIARYIELAETPRLSGFLRGWLNRAVSLSNVITNAN